MSQQPFKTDVVSRTKLDVGAASLGSSSSHAQSSSASTLISSKEHLQQISQDLNRRVDTEIETLANGMLELTRLASISDKDPVKAAHDAWQSKCRAEAMVKATEGLLAISHSLKILFVLKDDEPSLAKSRRAQAEQLSTQLQSQRDEAFALIDEYIRTLNQTEQPSS